MTNNAKKMKRKSLLKKIVCLLLALAMVIPMITSMVVNASEKIIETTQIDGEDYVAVSELMNQMEYIVSRVDDETYGSGLTVIVDDKILNIYENCHQYYLNGEMLPIVTEEVKDSTTNEVYNFPISQLPEKTEYNYDFYVPTEFLYEYLNIELPGEKGYAFEIPDETTELIVDGETTESVEGETETTEETEAVYKVVPDETTETESTIKTEVIQ